MTSLQRFMARLTMLFFFLALILAITSMVISWETNRLQKEYRAMEAQLHQSQSDLRVLHAEWSRLNRPDYLKEQAEKYLDLKHITSERLIDTVTQLPEKSQNVPLNLDEPENEPEQRSIEDILNSYLGE